MARIAILFGVLLIALGGGLFFITGMEHYTALIPAGFGIAFVLLGVLAFNEKLHKHVMHAAAFLGLVGFAIPIFRVIQAMTREDFEFNTPVQGQIAMAVLCLLFVVLCVKSFIDARNARKQKEGEATIRPV